MQETDSSNTDYGGGDASEPESCFVWFQSSPLAFENGPTAHHLPPLDIQQEKDVMQRVFDEAPTLKRGSGRKRQRVHFEIGTPRQLGSFLQLVRNQPNHCVSLHISCHAESEYLAFEDGWGTALPITIKDLQDVLQSHRFGGENFASVFQLIFIAACKSRSIGQALRNAGATNIICAYSDETDMNVSYVLEFSKVLYSTFLASESVSVKEAYDRAMHEVSLYPSYRGLPPQLCLLSDEQQQVAKERCTTCQGDHGVVHLPGKRCTYSHFPRPPSYFARQDTEVWKVLQLVKDTQDENARIIWVTGQDELGMKCTIQSACKCLHERFDTNSLEGIVWMELRVHESLCNGTYDVPLCQVTHQINERAEIQDRNMVIVLDATRLGYESCPLLVDKISTLIETTQHLKFIIINSEPLHLTWNCEDRHISIPALGLESTIKIFGKLCRHVKEERAPGINSSTTLWNEMVRGMNVNGDDYDASLLSFARYRALYKAFGKGKLNNVVNMARSMSKEEFLQYVTLGQFRSTDLLHSRYLLLKYSHQLQYCIFHALAKKEEVSELQDRLDIVALILHEVPSMTELWTKLEFVSKQLQEFYRHPRYAKRNASEVSRLKEQEHDIKRQIQLAACFCVLPDYTVADLGTCTKKERELELIVDFTNDLLFQYQIHQGDLEKEALEASLKNGTANIEAMQQCLEQGLQRPQMVLFSKLDCLPLPPSQVDCDHYLGIRKMEQRLKSAVKIQARVRGMLSRMEHGKRKKNAFLVNVQKMMQGSLQRISCRRVVPDEDEAPEQDNKQHQQESQYPQGDLDETMTQASTVVSTVTEDFKRFSEEVCKRGVDDLAQSIHTATTAPLSELSHSAHRSIQGFVRQVSFRVQDRWKTGAPQREFLFSKTFDEKASSSQKEAKQASSRRAKSRWDTGTPPHEVMLSCSFR